ncbi:MAG: MmcQ/YjbR family DNA-binding protein [Oscillospiraceae bacterium]|nr:MmcQ/YjbR family DNA-binding protein [Oscillospiraceae bacterium]
MEKYGVEADYPFSTAPSFPVLRHKDNNKWFALIMDVPREKLGLRGEERVDIINIKLADPFFADFIIQQEGFFKGYHQSGNWVSILLDGTVSFEEVCRMIDESFIVTASKQKKKKIRPPKEWLVPANPKYYDIEHAFDHTNEINWKQGIGIKTGDTVFIYVGAPVSAVLYKCEVTKTDIPYDYNDENLSISAVMKIKLLKRYSPEQFPFASLKQDYGIFAVRAPRGVPHSLSKALDK